MAKTRTQRKVRNVRKLRSKKSVRGRIKKTRRRRVRSKRRTCRPNQRGTRNRCRRKQRGGGGGPGGGGSAPGEDPAIFSRTMEGFSDWTSNELLEKAISIGINPGIIRHFESYLEVNPRGGVGLLEEETWRAFDQKLVKLIEDPSRRLVSNGNALMAAAARGSASHKLIVQNLLKYPYYVDAINKKDRNGSTALYFALMDGVAGNGSIAEMLVDKGAHMDDINGTYEIEQLIDPEELEQLKEVESRAANEGEPGETSEPTRETPEKGGQDEQSPQEMITIICNLASLAGDQGRRSVQNITREGYEYILKIKGFFHFHTRQTPAPPLREHSWDKVSEDYKAYIKRTHPERGNIDVTALPTSYVTKLYGNMEDPTVKSEIKSDMDLIMWAHEIGLPKDVTPSPSRALPDVRSLLLKRSGDRIIFSGSTIPEDIPVQLYPDEIHTQDRLMKIVAARAGLTWLELQGNQLTSLPESFGQLAGLTSLILWGNQLTTLPESFGQLTGLTYLDLGGNQLTTLPESFGQLTSLTHLYLNYNKPLTTLPESFGNLTGLTSLELDDNQLTGLPESFGNLTGLTELHLGNNQLTGLPESFGSLTGLTELHLGNNQLTELRESFGNLTGLTWLELQGNHLTTLPESFKNLAGLTYLELDDNQLTTLPESFGNLTGLIELNLNNNQLTKLPDTFGGLTSLRILNLINNKLTDLPELFMANHTALTTLRLLNNPLKKLPPNFAQRIESYNISIDLNDTELEELTRER
jgi:Leucine-rich repeat (LRR) protein